MRIIMMIMNLRDKDHSGDTTFIRELDVMTIGWLVNVTPWLKKQTVEAFRGLDASPV